MSLRVYEILFIADPNLGEPEVDALTATLQAFVEKEGGKVEKVEKWGKKRLAYLVKRHREGSYVLMVAHGGSDMMREVERRIRVTDGVIKFMTVRVDEEVKKADRHKAKRTAEDEKRRSRSPERPAPASLPSAPSSAPTAPPAPVEGVQL